MNCCNSHDTLFSHIDREKKMKYFSNKSNSSENASKALNHFQQALFPDSSKRTFHEHRLLPLIIRKNLPFTFENPCCLEFVNTLIAPAVRSVEIAFRFL